METDRFLLLEREEGVLTERNKKRGREDMSPEEEKALKKTAPARQDNIGKARRKSVYAPLKRGRINHSKNF